MATSEWIAIMSSPCACGRCALAVRRGAPWPIAARPRGPHRPIAWCGCRRRSPITDCSVGARPARTSTCPGFIPQADSEREVALDRVGPNFFHADRCARDSRPRHRAARSRDRAARHGDQRDDGEALFRCSRSTRRYGDGRQPSRYVVVGVVRDFQSSSTSARKPRREMYVAFNDPTMGDAGQAKLSVHVRGDPSRFVNRFVVRSQASIRTLRSSSIR